jgi:hypothetical protein
MFTKLLKWLGLTAVWYLIRSAISSAYADGDAVNFSGCEVEVDLTPAASAYANIDSWSTDVTCDPRTVPTTEINTFTHPSAIVFTGKPAPMNVTVTIVFTQDSTDPFVNLFNVTQGAAMDLRWGPAGAGSGGLAFTTTGGKFTSMGIPSGSADGSTASVVPFVVRAGGVSMGTIA